MEVVSVSPLPAGSVLWQKGQGWVLTIACKGTFQLVPGECVLAKEQEPIHPADKHWRDDATKSVYAPADLVPIKPRADVVLVGSVFASGAAARSRVARLRVGRIDKSVEVYVDRVARPDGVVIDGPRFTRMPLVFERAAGGSRSVNPVGIAREARDAYGRAILPNLQQPGIRITGVDTHFEPIGFGPIASTWPQRAEKVTRHPTLAGLSDWAMRAVPEDFDLAYFNVASPDQQLIGLRDDERIVLENLHRDHALLATSLPGLHPCAFVEGTMGAPFRVPMNADTLWFDTDRGLCTVTWRRQVTVEHRDAPGRIVVALERPGQTLSWAEVSGLLPGSDDEEDDDLEIQTLSPRAMSKEEAEQTGAAIPIADLCASLPFRDLANQPVNSRATLALELPQVGGALPFASPQGHLPQPPPVPAPRPAFSSTTDLPPLPPAVTPWAPPPAAPPSRPEAPASTSSVDSHWGLPLNTDPVAVAKFGAPPEPGVAVAQSYGLQGFAPAAAVGLLSASNAAADPYAKGEIRPAGTRRSRPKVEVLKLLWFDPESPARIRRSRAFKPILEALELRPADRDLDDPSLEPDEAEDRREVFEVLSQGKFEYVSGLQAALDDAVRDDGKFVPQLVLFRAELFFPFDALETVRAAVATAAPLVTDSDEALKAAVTNARRFLESADALTPPSVSAGITSKIKEAFLLDKKLMSEFYLDEQTDRVLLEQRRYDKRIVFGDLHLRCLANLGDSDARPPAYLPESLTKRLPMYQKFGARLIAEVHHREDQYESHSLALRVVALARAIAPEGVG